ncbi:MAG: hypothetical protein ACRESZ_08980 [Methylococcales bacterium]
MSRRRLAESRSPAGRIAQLASDSKVIGVVDGRLGAKRPAFFVIRFDLAVLVPGGWRRDPFFGWYPSPKATRRPLGHPPIENRLHLTGPTHIEVLTDDFLKEQVTGSGKIQHLSRRKPGLEN